jgi:hypothetical protein
VALALDSCPWDSSGMDNALASHHSHKSVDSPSDNTVVLASVREPCLASSAETVVAVVAVVAVAASLAGLSAVALLPENTASSSSSHHHYSSAPPPATASSPQNSSKTTNNPPIITASPTNFLLAYISSKYSLLSLRNSSTSGSGIILCENRHSLPILQHLSRW